MKQPLKSLPLIAAALLLPSLALAAPSGRQICQKMIADGRANGMSQQNCECNYRVADAILDDDLKALLFDAWYTGRNNTPAMERLPNQRRIVRQLRTMQNSLPANCE